MTAWIYLKPYLGYNTNQLKVSVDQPLDVNQISIFKGIYTNKRVSEFELFKWIRVLIFNGINLKPIVNDYGENDFLLVMPILVTFKLGISKPTINNEIPINLRFS